MIDLHAQILEKDGRREFVVLPYEEYVTLQELLEDVKDLLELRAAKEEHAGKPSMSIDEVRRRFGFEA